MTSGAGDRRRLQRVHLSTPLSGRVRGQAVHIMDVSLRGLRVAHQSAIGRIGDLVVIAFDWDGTHIEAECELRRSELQRIGRAAYSHTLYHSGLTLRGIDDTSRAAIRRLIEEQVTLSLDEQKANARGNVKAAPQEQPVPTEYVRHQLVDGRWRMTRTAESAQPFDGFTIASGHTKAEVQMLRNGYMTGDAAARADIRRIAALSLGAAPSKQ